MKYKDRAKKRKLWFGFSSFFIVCLVIASCTPKTEEVSIPNPSGVSYGIEQTEMSKESYHDKVLGALVGSAIGDAMGVSTEMWNRSAIQKRYGYIEGLTPALMPQSPEGPWGHNLPAGSTTDDTRWKYMLTQYIDQNTSRLSREEFAQFIIDYYQNQVGTLSDKELLTQPDDLDVRIEKIDWIKEWARVALAYQESDAKYEQVRDRFYGGEMSCAGLLYTPMFGLIASNATEAYNLAYDHTLFDIGYARDISSIAAAMTHMALHTQNMDSILATQSYIDPYGYQDSRLIARIPQAIANTTHDYVLGAFEIDEIELTEALILNDSITIAKIPEGAAIVLHKDSVKLKIPTNYTGSDLEWFQQETIYEALEENQRQIAFHAGEIWEILYAGLLFGGGDFEKTLQFIINYGRDNDTVGAIAGMILGAKDGYDHLPSILKEEVIQVHKEQIGIDLEALAQQLVDSVYPD